MHCVQCVNLSDKQPDITLLVSCCNIVLFVCIVCLSECGLVTTACADCYCEILIEIDVHS